MNLKNFLALFNMATQGEKVLCIRNQFSDYYIGFLDGSTSKDEYEELFDKNVIGIDFDTTAFSGSIEVEIDIEITIEYEGED